MFSIDLKVNHTRDFDKNSVLLFTPARKNASQETTTSKKDTHEPSTHIGLKTRAKDYKTEIRKMFRHLSTNKVFVGTHEGTQTIPQASHRTEITRKTLNITVLKAPTPSVP